MTISRLKPNTKLRVVEQSSYVTMLLRADIEARDWSAVHVAGDRRKAVDLPDSVKRWWR